MLEIANVSFSYTTSRPILSDVSLTIAEGEFVAVAGRNGSGKTTLTKLFMSLIKPVSGTVSFNGVNTKKHAVADMARVIGYVFQNPDRQIFQDTVANEVAYGPKQLGFSTERIDEVVRQALALTGLSELAQTYPRTLSKGQKQRVTIASALAMQPKMLILDEPTSGQDVIERNSLLQLLARLNENGLAIILVTHDMDILSRYPSRVIVMNAGSKVFDGKVSRLFAGDINVSAWGLKEPAAVIISRELAKYGVKPALVIETLTDELIKRLRSECDV